MELAQRKLRLNVSKLIFYFLVVCSILMIVGSIVLYNVSISSVIKYILYFILYIQIPGILLLLFFKQSFFTNLIKQILASFLGIFVLVLEYYFLSFLGLYDTIKYINPIVSIILVGIIFISKKIKVTSVISLFRNVEVNYTFGIYLCIIFLSSILVLQYSYVNPGSMDSLSIVNQDLLWHMGNVNSLSQGYPAYDARICDIQFKYHYFNDLIPALCLKIFNVPADDLIISCTPYFITYVFGFSSYAFVCEYCNRESNAAVYCIIILLSGMFLTIGNINLDISSYINAHIFANTNAVATGLSATFVYLIMVKKVFENKCENIGVAVFVLGILIGTITGLKGPFGAILVAAMFFTFVTKSFFERKLNYKLLIITVIVSVFFMTVYFFMISFGEGPTGSGLDISIFGTVSRSAFGRGVDLLIPPGVVSGILKLFMIFVQCIYIFLGFSIPYIYYIYTKANELLCDKKSYDDTEIHLIYIVFIGVCGFFMINHYGFSQVYFMFPTIYAVAVSVFKMYERSYDPEKKLHTNLKKWFVVGMFCGIIAFIVCFSVNIKSAFDAYDVASDKIAYEARINKELNRYEDDKNMQSDINRLISNYKYSETVFLIEQLQYNTLSKMEYEGMIWLKENSALDSVCISDRHTTYSPGSYDDINLLNNRFFYYSAFSERNFFLEGFSYSSASDDEVKRKLAVRNSIYNENNEERGKEARKNNIDYVIVTDKINSGLNLENEDLKKCFKNEEITIYKVR